MAKQTKIKTAAANYAIPRDREEADKFIFEIFAATRRRAVIQTALDAELADLKARYEDAAAPLNSSIDLLTKGLQTWCEANRRALLQGNLKTVKFGNGYVSWRMRPASVTLRGIEKIIKWCRAQRGRFARFLRFKIEVNKEAMLAEPDEASKIPGVTIASGGEDFIVTPLESKLDEVA